jgi:asparagine synthase (glutamine-hydrolysing)
MCGLVGSISFGDRFRVTAPYIERMRDAMAHRGPDGAGVWISDDGKAGLGHRRLSIIDLSTAALQPMASDDATVQLVFNGEIYNHVGIRAELEGMGHRFRTDHSDTEALLRAYLQWGRDCVHRFRGMFAFAIWDGRSRELWLVRDRIGVKPLYYSQHHGRLTFASEIKALLRDPEQPRALNEDALAYYLSFLASPAPDTMFQGIHKLASGTWMLVRHDGSVKVERYWDALDNRVDLSGTSDEDLVASVMELLDEAVRLRMVSDVPVGVFLSGGIDSSTNAALFSRHSGGRVKTFSIGYDQDYGSAPNELEHARSVAKLLGTDHYEHKITQSELVDFLPKLVHLQDEPIGDPVCVPLYYVSKLARDNGVTVCQVGEGADELFWGYPEWKRDLELQNFIGRTTFGPQLAGIGGMALRWLGQGEGQTAERLRRGAAGRPTFWGGAQALTSSALNSLLSPRLKGADASARMWEAIGAIRNRFAAGGGGSALKWMAYLDLNYRLPELLLMRVDKMSMGVGLEARVPFLDHKLVEYALSIDEAVLTRGGQLKYLLKKAVRGLIPDHIIDRRKQGFGVPIHEWMMRDLGGHTNEVVRKFAKSTDLLDRQNVEARLTGGNSIQRWVLLNLALWWQMNIEGVPESI